MVCSSQRQRLIGDLHAALGSSLDLRTVLDAAFPVLARLIPVDCGAICVSNPASAGGYDWTTVDFPLDWFSTYIDMAPHDFVRRSVLARPNLVLRDSEMLSRADLEANRMYQRAREAKAPLEQVMSVMLDLNANGHAGVTLYRGRRRPFSDAQRALLQQVAPCVANAVRNCKLFAEASWRGDVPHLILRTKNVEYVLMSMSPKAIPTSRTEGFNTLINRWFDPAELDRFGVPIELLNMLRRTARIHERGAAPPVVWTRPASMGFLLRVTFARIPESAHRTLWAIIFQETGKMPNAWKHILTRTELKVALGVLLGWDNRLIADDTGCRVTTVKKHLENIFDKLGVSSRTALCHIASQHG
jgi:DNA-binding CsgD family transcriptional regulator